MNHWLIFFQPHAAEWPEVKRRNVLRDYLTINREIEKGDIAYLVAGSYGFCGWGYIRALRRNEVNLPEGRMYVELMFDQLRENILKESEIGDHSQIRELRNRATTNFVLLKPSAVNALNQILRKNNLDDPGDVPEFEERIGKFGFKDTTSLAHEIDIAADQYGTVSLMFLDLDNFKAVNDQFDHTVGDNVIRQSLGLINQTIGGNGQLFHRSGDEIVILLPNVGRVASLGLAEAVRQEIERFEYPDIGAGFVTTTIGITTYPSPCRNLEMLEITADQLAMQAKKLRKNSVLFG